MLHPHANRVALCTRGNNNHLYTFKIFDFVFSPETVYEETANFRIQNLLHHIAPLTAKLYMALDENGRFNIVGADGSAAVKKVFYKTGTYDISALSKGGASPIQTMSISADGKTYTTWQEDFFTHLAVDNTLDRAQGEKDQCAAAFVAVNREGDIFWSSFKKCFWGSRHGVTLYRINPYKSLDGRDITRIWLKGDRIGVLCRDKAIKMFDVRFI